MPMKQHTKMIETQTLSWWIMTYLHSKWSVVSISGKLSSQYSISSKSVLALWIMTYLEPANMSIVRSSSYLESGEW